MDHATMPEPLHQYLLPAVKRDVCLLLDAKAYEYILAVVIMRNEYQLNYLVVPPPST